MTDSRNSIHLGGDAVLGPRAALTAVAVAAVVTLLVVLPLAGKGWLFLLDWVRGPHAPVPRSFWGLDGGLLAAVPFGTLALVLGRLTDPATMTWLPIAIGIFVAGASMGRLVGGPAVRRVVAGLLYAVNPLVFERVYAGQVAFLLAYGLLPLAVASLLRADEAESWPERLRPAVWITVVAGLAPHFAWILAVVCVVQLLTHPSRRTFTWLAALAAITVLTNSYLLVSSMGRPMPVEVGAGDLASFRTTGDNSLGLFGNLATLHGFWRVEVPLPKDEVPGFPLFMGAIALVSFAGARASLRHPQTRRLATVLAGAGVIGYVLALGDQGPIGPVYRWMFLDVPGFAIMREPQKFAALTALAYAGFFGFGADEIVKRTEGRRARRAFVGVALLLPLAATPTLFWGLSGHVRPRHYPVSWQEADRVMGDGSGKVLFLPWHQYLSFPFTGRVVANPAPVAFRRDVIAGDNVELSRVPTASTSTRSAYLEFLYGVGPDLRSFGQLVAPQGVEYVVVAKTVDWQRYSWLADQNDLQQVLDRPEIVVYRNLRPVGDGRRAPAEWSVEDWGEVAGLSDAMDLSGTVLDVRQQAPGPVRVPTVMPPPTGGPLSDSRDVERRSEISYRIRAGRPGVVSIAEPFDESWRLGEERAFELAGGIVGLRTDGTAGTAQFGHWKRVRTGYAVSGLTCLAVLAAGLTRARGAGRGSRAERYEVDLDGSRSFRRRLPRRDRPRTLGLLGHSD